MSDVDSTSFDHGLGKKEMHTLLLRLHGARVGVVRELSCRNVGAEMP